MTTTGEIAENKELSINCQQIQKEEIFDGYYGACTNLEDNVSEIININKGRWEIEESFRIMKTELKSRPVYL
ncbi:MAG: transposase, partial [Christensenellaceae bacterium]|nr:transposase [Christensenellaceae bacterium]